MLHNVQFCWQWEIWPAMPLRNPRATLDVQVVLSTFVPHLRQNDHHGWGLP